MPSNVEVKIDTAAPPTLAQAKMLLTWIGEYYPGLVVTDDAPEALPEEQVDNGEVEGAQLALDYNEETGEIRKHDAGADESPDAAEEAVGPEEELAETGE